MQHLYLRHYREIAYLAVNPDVPRTQLVGAFGLSSYEYTSDIPQLEALAPAYGMALSFGDHAVMTVTDRRLFQSKYPSLRGFHYRLRPPMADDEALAVRVFIGRRLLQAHGCITLEQLAGQVGYSKSSLRGTLRWLRRLLAGYGIRLSTVPAHGLKAVGSEFSIRRCLAALYELIDVDVIPFQDDDGIADGFAPRRYGRLDQAIGDVLEHRFDVTNIARRRLAGYLTVAAARCRFGMTVGSLDGIDPAYRDRAVTGRAMDIADALAKRLAAGMDMDITATAERQALAVMVAAADGDSSDWRLLAGALSEPLCRTIEQTLTGWLAGSYGLKLTRTDCPALFAAIDQMVIRHGFGMLSDGLDDLDGNPAWLNDDPMMAIMRGQLAGCLAPLFPYPLPISRLGPLLAAIHYHIAGLSIDCPRLKIGIMSRGDPLEPVQVRRLLRQQLDPDCCEVADCLDYDQADGPDAYYYDLLIADTMPAATRLDVICLADRPDVCDHLGRLVKNRRQLCRHALHFVRSQPWSRTVGDPRLEQARRQGFEAVVNGVLFIIVPFGNEGQRSLTVGSGGGPKGYVLLQAPIDSSVIRLYDVLLRQLAADAAFRGRLIADPLLKDINDRLNAVID